MTKVVYMFSCEAKVMQKFCQTAVNSNRCSDIHTRSPLGPLSPGLPMMPWKTDVNTKITAC